MKFDKKYLLALIPLLILGAVVYYFRELVSYIIIAWVISMIGAPLVTFLRKYIGKNGSAFVTLSIFGLLLFLLLYVFIPPLVNQARNLSNVDYTRVVKIIEEPLKDWENWLIDKRIMKNPNAPEIEVKPINEENKFFDKTIVLDSLLNPKDSTYLTHVAINVRIDASEILNIANNNQKQVIVDEDSDFFKKIRENIIYYLNPRRIQAVFSAALSAFGNIAIGTLSVFFIAFFFLKEQGLFYEMIRSLVPIQYEDQMTHAIDDSSKLLIRYFIGVLSQITIILVYLSVVLKLLSIENALLIAFFAALTNVIPYLGPIIGFSIALVITVSGHLEASFYNDLFPQIIRLAIAFGSMQLLDNFILQPNIFSKSVKAHPLEIFLIVMIGAKVGGILGMVVA
ncbi:MAG TPA: AI-2E family transporter, partial [Saprospiraceae bacterium]|nr:AI-2E family transporter [Saprospiraceae bacterium]